MEVIAVNGMATSWVVLILGVVVTAIGYFMLPGEFAAGVLGFGLAHIVLGFLDMFRPTVRQ
jgi:1,4-dihydroxy-2-naphthoate octaprenyltransferase